MASAPEIDFAALMPAVAARLFGEPNPRLSSKTELRYGSHGSLAIDVEHGTFYDHEHNQGGGVLDLIARERGGDAKGALEWLEQENLKEAEPVWQIGKRPTVVAFAKPTRVFYDYCDADGKVAYRVERREQDGGKTFLQHGPDGNGGFAARRGGMAGVSPLPYRLDEWVNADPGRGVFIVEGEKDADRLTALGLLATCNSGGAGKFSKDIGHWFSGRRVVIVPDNDEAGATHGQDVAAKLFGVADVVSILDLPNLPPKGDVSDWLDAGGTAEDLKDLAREAKLWMPAALEDDAAPELLPLADLSLWAATEPTPKPFLMAGLIPAGELTLITGDGGANKSTFGQQLATCAAAGLPMLGIDVQPGPALYITCEDDFDRLHWVQNHISKALGVSLSDIEGKLHLSSLRGRLGNELATFDAEGKLRAGSAFAQLRETVIQTKPRLLVLDNQAHFFIGNENDRAQVTAFVNLLYSLCLDHGVTVLLVAHRNKAGDSYSGSTAWLNAVRSQIVLTRPEGSVDPDARELTLGKANYARQGEKLSFRWHDFALRLDSDLSEDTRAALAVSIETAGANAAFLECLRVRNSQGEARGVGASPGPNYAPTQFEGMMEAKGFGKAALKSAMDRLFSLGKIETWNWENKGKGRKVCLIREATEVSRTPSRTPPEHSSRTIPKSHPNTPPHTLSLTGGRGRASEAAAPDDKVVFEPDYPHGNPALEARGPILAAGESVDDEVPGATGL